MDRDVGQVEERIARLYGDDVDWCTATGRLHVAAIHAASERVLAIGPAAPPSETDRFVLGLARARADVIVTTGSILRAEPELVHRFAETPQADAAFAAWRRSVLGRADPPRLLVLSASGDLPKAHPAFAASTGASFVAPSSAGVHGIVFAVAMMTRLVARTYGTHIPATRSKRANRRCARCQPLASKE